MDNNLEVMKAMNYGYDNPEFRNKVNPDEAIVKVAAKSVLNKSVMEQIALYASLSKDSNAYKMALEQLEHLKQMNNGIERTKTI